MTRLSMKIALGILTCLIELVSEAESWTLNNILLTVPKQDVNIKNLSLINSTNYNSDYLHLTEIVSQGLLKGLEECRYQFQWDLWNCPDTPSTIFSKNTASGGNREVAFVQAIGSAGVMYIITKNCSLGGMGGMCRCDLSRNGRPGGHNWRWGGCSDNVAFGEQVTKQFLSEFEKGRDARAAMNVHNKQVGARAVTKTMKLACKCHGVSGSCTIRTCWKQLGDFRAAGKYLKKKYKRATRVSYQSGKLRQGNIARNIQFPKVTQNDLVYLENSPNYCYADNSLRSSRDFSRHYTRYSRRKFAQYATLGRECRRTVDDSESPARGRKSCRRLCRDCELRVRKVVQQEVTKCNCKFKWCCMVKCKECVQTVTRYYCKP